MSESTALTVQKLDLVRSQVLRILGEIFDSLGNSIQAQNRSVFTIQAIGRDCEFLADGFTDLGEDFVRDELWRIAQEAKELKGTSTLIYSLETLANVFDQQDPPNQLMFPYGDLEIRISRANGKSEHQLLCERTEERDWLLRKFARLRDWLHRSPDQGDEVTEEIFDLVALMASEEPLCLRCEKEACECQA